MTNDQKQPHLRVAPDDRARVSLNATVIRLDNGHALAEAINPDGTTAYWVLSPEGSAAPQGCACRDCAPHDQRNPFRTTCGAPTASTGKPCQNRTRVGERCPAHRP